MKFPGVLILAAILAIASTAACNGISAYLKPSFGMVIKYELMPGTTEKHGIHAVTDEGRRVFGHAGLRAPEILGRSGGTLSYVGAGIPKWIRVTWREDVETGKYWTTGTIVGDYTLPIASRIPPQVLKYASGGKGRALYLIFRIKDDGVLLAWSVQESVRHPKGGSGYVYSLHGGDFPCNPVSPHASGPNCTSGNLKDAHWYNPLWIKD